MLPSHLCWLPATVGFIGTCWMSVCFCPISPLLAVMAIVAPLVSLVLTPIFTAWLKFRIGENAENVLSSHFWMIAAIGAANGLITMSLLILYFSGSAIFENFTTCACFSVFQALSMAEITSILLKSKRTRIKHTLEPRFFIGQNRMAE